MYYRSGNAELANDLAQEVFVKLWEKRQSIEQMQIQALLYKMSSDAWIDHLRRHRLESEYIGSLELKVDQNHPENQAQFEELKQNYQKALGQLPEKQRTVFMMNRMESLTYKEIASRLGIGLKAVEKRMSAAIAQLRKNIPVL